METKSSTNARGLFSFEFNPRSFVIPLKESPASPSCSTKTLDAIFIPTRQRSDFVTQLIRKLPQAATAIFVMPTSPKDFATATLELPQNVHCLALADQHFLNIHARLRCSYNRLCLRPDFPWDLPLKRNYALWFARQNKLRNILLLDDDMRGITSLILEQGASALDHHSLCGLYVDDFPDTSVIGHINIASGDTEWTFISGNSLFVRADLNLGFFPPIYNEDWIFLTPHLVRKHVAVIGNVRQEPYDPFTNPSLASFQEPGEVIAEGLFALLHAHAYDQRFNLVAWSELLQLRQELITTLLQRSLHGQLRSAAILALRRCNEITASDCVQFIEDWEHDCELWNSAL
jgi:hypothetical protein